MSFLRRSEREWANNSVVEPALSDGAAQVLAVIGRAYVVVDEVGGVAQASPRGLRDGPGARAHGSF